MVEKKQPLFLSVKFIGTLIAVLGILLLVMGAVILSRDDWGLGFVMIVAGLGGGVLGLIIRNGGITSDH